MTVLLHEEGPPIMFNRSTYFFLIAAGISLVLSIYLWFSGQREEGQFVGLWVPSILVLGVLFKQGKGR